MRFTEKPELSLAKAFLAEGGYFWNSGMFLFKPSTVIAAFEKHAPLLWQQNKRILDYIDAETFFGRKVYSIPEKYQIGRFSISIC